jgi:hypothetical protein
MTRQLHPNEVPAMSHQQPGHIIDFQQYFHRRRYEAQHGVRLPPLAHDLRVLRDSDDEFELVDALERVVVLGPPSLEIEPLLTDVAGVLVARYAALLGPWSRPVSLNPYVTIPSIIRELPRVATVLALMQGRSPAWLLHECPLSPVETCAVLAMLQRLRTLLWGAAHGPEVLPVELGQPFLPRACDAFYQFRKRALATLRGYQLALRAETDEYEPWARCPLHVMASPPPDPLLGAVVAVLVDALASPGYLQVQSAQWVSDEFLARTLRAYLFHVPAGAVQVALALAPYTDRPQRWQLTCEVGQLKLARLAPAQRGWVLDEQTLTF